MEAQKHMWEGSAIATRPGVMSMADAMNYALTQPVSTIIIGCDNIPQLEENVKIARAFTPPSPAQMAALDTAAVPVARQSPFFRFTDRSSG
jgi:aryl-alcohol dehydrogenase-like predicted oxidoreductase